MTLLVANIFALLILINFCSGQYRTPEIVEHPADLLVPRNEPATLNCHANGRPSPTISWFKNGKEFKIKKEGEGRHVLLSNGDLFFLRVLQTKKDDDTGLYWCQAKNEVGVVRSRNATLEIAILKEDFEGVPEDARVAEGKTALLKCIPPKGHPEPVVVWTKNGDEIDPATQHRFKIVDKGSLVITGVRVSDSGVYVCRARNVYGSRETKPANLTVLVPPHFVSSSGAVTGTSGSTIELVCRVGGDPPPEVFWERAPPGELPIERMVQEENGQVLRIRHASPEDEGVYTCRAENPVGSEKRNTTLVIHSRPVIKVSPVEARVGINGSVSFECLTSGNPKPTTYWTHEGTGVVIGTGQAWGEGRVFVDSKNTLTISRVTKGDQGYYVCSAVGVAGSALSRAHLEVQSVTDMPPPLIALGAPNQTLPLNTEGEMPCEARGTPEPKIFWFIGEESFKSSDRMSVTPFGTLRITGLKATDTGTYTCRAVSESGTTEWTTSLAVAKPTNPNVAFYKMPSDSALPEPPAQVTVLSINSSTVTLGWRRGRPGSSPILSYAVQHWSPDARGPWVTASIKQTSLSVMPVGVIVTNLVPNTRYVFVARASNSHGLSRPSDVTPMVRTIGTDAHEKLTLHEIRNRLAGPCIKLLSAESTTSTSIKVFWLLLVDSSIIEGIYVRYRSISDAPSSPAGALSVETVYLHKMDGPTPSSYVVTGLRPDTEYEVFVTPFYDNVEGQPTAALRSVTMESGPAAPPNNFQNYFINSTSVKFLWEPIPSHLSNGIITGYVLEVVDVSGDRRTLINSTVKNTSTIVSGLNPGSAYHVTIRGVTAGGVGPVSQPLAFTLPEVKTKETSPPTSLEFPAVNFETNYYLIVGIASASVVVFMLLFASVFYIYRHRRKNKSPSYFCKEESKDTWCEYPDCWNESCKSVSGTTTSNHVSRTTPISQSFPKSNSQQYFKGNCDPFDPCKVRTPEDLYEDPDGLRLVSFTKYSAKRCFSPEPYATTPLIADNHLKGSLRPVKNLPPNIPLKDMQNRGKSEDFCHQLSPSELNSSHLRYNYNIPMDKDSIGGPILQFPPPPPSAPLEDNYSEKSLQPFKNEISFTRFLQQQLPYSLAGSSSGGSQQSHGSPHVGPRPLRNTLKGSTPPRLLPSYKLPDHDYEGRLMSSDPKGGISECGIPLGGHNKENGCVLTNHFHDAKGQESETDCYSQPHNTAAIDSPNSSVQGDAEESESEAYSSGASCCSSNLPLAHSHELNFVESLRAASEARWGGRGDSMCSTDESCHGGHGPPLSIGIRGSLQKKGISGIIGQERRLDTPSFVCESVSSPLI